MHCNKCGSKDTETVKCGNCKQNSSIKCKACGNQFCSDKYCEIVALHEKRKQLSRIAIILFALILCTVPSTFAVMTGSVRKAAGIPETPAPTPEPPKTPAPPAPPAAAAATPTAPPVASAATPATPPPAPPASMPPPPAPTSAIAPPPSDAPLPAPPATPVPPPGPPPALSVEQQQANLASLIEAGLGTPYRKEGSSPKDGGVDAPGFVQWIYGQAGHPEITRDYGVLSKAGEEVKGTDYKPGDILLFSIKKDGNISFAGLYWKDGKFVYPFPKEQRVVEGDPGDAFFKPRFVGARRVVK